MSRSGRRKWSSVGVLLVALAAGCNEDADSPVRATSTVDASYGPTTITSEVLAPSISSTIVTGSTSALTITSTSAAPATTEAVPMSELDPVALLGGLRRLLDDRPASVGPREVEYGECAIGDLPELASLVAEVIPAVSVDGLIYQRRETNDGGGGRLECAGFAGSSETSPGIRIEVVSIVPGPDVAAQVDTIMYGPIRDRLGEPRSVGGGDLVAYCLDKFWSCGASWFDGDRTVAISLFVTEETVTLESAAEGLERLLPSIAASLTANA